MDSTGKRTGRRSRKSRKNLTGKSEENNNTAELKIMAVNCRSLANKKSSVQEILDQEKIDVAILSELNIKKEAPKMKGYRAFSNLSSRRFHGICVYLHNSLGPYTLRIPNNDEELEIVQILIKSTTPQTNVFGVYLDVEQRHKREDLTRIWHKLTSKV